MADITFLTANQNIGTAVVTILEKLNVKFLHTFSGDNVTGRRQKLAFFKGSARLKATTLHSFKGWESHSLVLYTGEKWDSRSKALIYTGLTRLKKSAAGSYMTVVCAIEQLSEFGRTWPDYEDKRRSMTIDIQL